MVPLERAIAVRLLARAAIGRYGGETIIAVPAECHWWKRAISELDLDPDVFRPYGLRRGGPQSFSAVRACLRPRCFEAGGRRFAVRAPTSLKA